MLEVGSLIRCAADAGPPARVTLQRLDGGRRDLVSGISKAEYRLPLNSREGKWTVRCLAVNDLGQDEKNSTFTVKSKILFNTSCQRRCDSGMIRSEERLRWGFIAAT